MYYGACMTQADVMTEAGCFELREISSFSNARELAEQLRAAARQDQNAMLPHERPLYYPAQRYLGHIGTLGAAQRAISHDRFEHDAHKRFHYVVMGTTYTPGHGTRPQVIGTAVIEPHAPLYERRGLLVPMFLSIAKRLGYLQRVVDP